MPINEWMAVDDGERVAVDDWIAAVKRAGAWFKTTTNVKGEGDNAIRSVSPACPEPVWSCPDDAETPWGLLRPHQATTLLPNGDGDLVLLFRIEEDDGNGGSMYYPAAVRLTAAPVLRDRWGNALAWDGETVKVIGTGRLLAVVELTNDSHFEGTPALDTLPKAVAEAIGDRKIPAGWEDRIALTVIEAESYYGAYASNLSPDSLLIEVFTERG